MKKTIFILTILLPIIIFAQENKNVETIKRDAAKWFKDVYVEQVFKKPHSYRLMGLIATPVSFKEMLMRDLADVQNDIDTCSVPETARNQKAYNDYMEKYKKCQAELIKESYSRKFNITDRDHILRCALLSNAKKGLSKLTKGIKSYLLAVEKKEKIVSLMHNLSEEEANKLAYYDIRLDCFSKNSSGDEVLRKFSFPFTEKGIFGGEDGISKVIELNK